jgi:hypothetical protein
VRRAANAMTTTIGQPTRQEMMMRLVDTSGLRDRIDHAPSGLVGRDTSGERTLPVGAHPGTRMLLGTQAGVSHR